MIFKYRFVKLRVKRKLLEEVCSAAAAVHRSVEKADLHIDTVNIDQHLGDSSYPTINGKLDIRCSMLKRFRIFHYNEFKSDYMSQIRQFWGYDL